MVVKVVDLKPRKPENNQRKPNVNDNEDVNDNVDDYVNE